MKLKHCKNHPAESTRWVKLDNLESFLFTEDVVKEFESKVPIGNDLIKIDLSNYMISLNGLSYPIAANKISPNGEYFIAEKWEFPYWKYKFSQYKNMVHVPSHSNPIGIHLIILGDLETEQKINFSIHQWPDPPHAEPYEFRQGPYDGSGCIRMKKDDLEILFNKIELGTKVISEK